MIAFIKGELKDYPHYYYFPSTYNTHELQDDEASHILYLRGDLKNGVLYAYIELFNFENALIIFDMDYKGVDFEDTYALDTLSGKTIDKKITIRLTRNHFEALALISDNFYAQYVNGYNRILKLIESRQLKGWPIVAEENQPRLLE